MFNFLRPFIFKFSPEVAHSLAIKALKLNNFPTNKIVKSEILQTNFCGKILSSPIGVAAGFDKNAEVYNPLFNLGFGFVEVGTITPKPQYGNPKPRVFRLEEDEALINRLGFNNSVSEEISSRMSKEIKKGIVVGFSTFEEKVGVAVGITSELTKKYDAVTLVKIASEILGGKGGGGRKDFAQAGGANKDKIEEAFRTLSKKIN